MAAKTYNIAVCGAGVVGGGLISLLARQRPLLSALKLNFVVKTVLCRDTAKRRPFDLPAGGRRLTQASVGYLATFVSGNAIMEHGEPTGVLPGKLLRGPQVRHA
jgi:homoserine dehydrogenase